MQKHLWKQITQVWLQIFTTELSTINGTVMNQKPYEWC